MKLREFAKREGFTVPQVTDLAERGLILGAECNPFSRKWDLSEDAQLVDWLRNSERKAQGVAPSSGASVMASGHADTNPPEAGLGALLLSLADQQAPEGRADGFDPEWLQDDAPGSAGAGGVGFAIEEAAGVFAKLELRATCLSISKAAARLNRNVYHLRIDAVELLHLVEALNCNRSKLKQAISRGVKQYGELRATDKVWRKLQAAMAHCQQRRPA